MKYLLPFTLGLSLLFSCKNDDTHAVCEKEIIVSSDFDNIESDAFSVISAQIVDQCLEMTIGAGGCDGDSWTAEMYTAEVILTVFPPTIPLKCALSDQELCEAFIQRTFSFNLEAIIERYSQFSLSIEGYDEIIDYD